MKVLIYGAGRFGRAVAEEFARYPRIFTEVIISDPHPQILTDLPEGIRLAANVHREAADIVVLAASLVPHGARERLLKTYAPIDAFWELERRYNLPMIQRLVPWIETGNWRMLVVATNPVDDWVNALHLLLGNRKVIGLGTAFDSTRIRFLAAALSPGSELPVLRHLRVIGGHGSAIKSGRLARGEVFEVAKWMSDALSIALLRAPDFYAKTWWTEVAIRPLVRGFAGIPTWTHLVVPVAYGGVIAATGLDVRVKHLSLRKRPLGRLSVDTRREFILYLKKMRQIGETLARKISGEPVRGVLGNVADL